MTVAYVGAEAIVLRDVAAWLAASAAFQTFTGTADATAAAARIVEIDGEDPGLAHAAIDTPVLRVQRTAGGAYDGTADVLLAFAGPATAGDTAAEIHRRALAHVAAVRADLLAAARGRLLTVISDPPTIADPSDGLPAWVEWSLALTVEARP